MDIYSRKAPSLGRKLFLTIVQIVFIAFASWIMFGGGADIVLGWFGIEAFDAPLFRRITLLVFSIVTLARFSLMMFGWLEREISLAELISVPLAFFLYFVVFPLLALTHPGGLDLLDVLGIALFVLGAALNTVGEWQRSRFKADPANKGKLFTGGLFAWSMHINYLGDVLWVTGFALVAHSLWGAIIPLVLLGFFVFSGIPALDAHLARRYGDQFTAYAARTKKLVPLVW